MSENVVIAGTFDVAQTRQYIRRLAEVHRWSNLLRVRAIAALTALAEVLYFRRPNLRESLRVQISVLDTGERRGIEFQADARFTAICKQFVLARWQLERACDELVVQKDGELEHIVMRVWVNGGAS